MPRLILDANLIVLLAVGDSDPREIALPKRLQAYDLDDYARLLDIAKRFATIATLPNLLTQASNLLRQCPEHKQARFAASLATFARGTTKSTKPAAT